MNRFQIKPNRYLDRVIDSFYHTPYTKFRSPGNPDYINHLKNTYNSFKRTKLDLATQKLRAVLRQDLPNIYKSLGNRTLVACVVPRAKAEQEYFPNQQRFRSTVQAVARESNGLSDGTHYLRRHTNTKTTHLGNKIPNNDGSAPYPGITLKTCDISADTAGQNILLIDDIYTPGVNIDEDAIQALLNSGARSVCFYAVGRVGRTIG